MDGDDKEGNGSNVAVTAFGDRKVRGALQDFITTYQGDDITIVPAIPKSYCLLPVPTFS
jgi:hypothetical protein